MFNTRHIFYSAAALAVALIASVATEASAQTTLFDDVTSATSFTFTGSTPRTYMGDGFTNTSLPAGTASFQITSFNLYFVSTAATAYTDIVGRIQFWNTANGGTTSAANPAFANAAGGLISIDFGALTTTANGINEFTITLNTPVTLTVGSGNNWGFAQNFQSSTTGGAVADDTTLTSLITYNTSTTAPGYATGAVTTGTSPNFGYYRNANSETNFNFTSTSRSLGLAYQGVGIQIYGNPIAGAAVPEPSAVSLAVLGGVLLLGVVGRVRRCA